MLIFPHTLLRPIGCTNAKLIWAFEELKGDLINSCDEGTFLAMGEIQLQKYICKICNKTCVSGKSLGGHMRVHLALISASKRAAEQKAETKIEIKSKGGGDEEEGSFGLKKCSKNQSSSGVDGNEDARNCEANSDEDQNISYELRENPKKSWRISDPRCVVSKNGTSCKECGKEFPSLRALSGHMRSHVPRKEHHKCKKCGREFNSLRALFGHMKSHSKKSRIPDGTNADSLSDLEKLCPVRRKRSKIRYKAPPNPSCLSASASVVSEHEEAEEVAECLMMLSRGVMDWVKFDSVIESSDDGSVHFEAELSDKSKNLNVDFLCDGDEKMETDVLTGWLDNCVSGSTCAFPENVSDYCVFAAKNRGVGKVVEPEPVNESAAMDFVDNFMSSDFEKNCPENKDCGVDVREHRHERIISQETCDSKSDQLECSNNQDEQESAGRNTVSVDLSKSMECACSMWSEAFPSDQDLGFHRGAHQEGVGVPNLLDLNHPISAVD